MPASSSYMDDWGYQNRGTYIKEEREKLRLWHDALMITAEAEADQWQTSIRFEQPQIERVASGR